MIRVGGRQGAFWVLVVLSTAAGGAQAQAAAGSARAIKISVDATQAARRVLHSQLEIPATLGL